MRVGTHGSWTADVPEGLTQLDNGDSWQAYDERIVVYVSSLQIAGPDGVGPTRTEIAAVAASDVPSGGDAERLSFDSGTVIGQAAVAPAEGGWRLTGYAAADGTLATCVVDFAHPDDRDHVEGIWRSLSVGHT